MARTRLGIYDVETKFASKLGAYLMLNEKDCIEAHIFSDEARLKSCWDDLDVILVPEDFDEAENPKVIRLVEVKDKRPGIQLRKYQKAGTLINEVKTVFSISGGEKLKGTGNIICVLSPSRHELQMLYSMCLCKQLSIHSKTLYLNLSEYSGFLSLFGSEDAANIEDLFSELESGIPLERYVQVNQGVTFVPPTKKPELLHEIDSNIMSEFISLLRNSDYENVVIDIGAFFPELYSLLGECEKIVTLGREGFLNDYALNDFEENLVLHLGEGITEKMQNAVLPLNSAGIWKSDFILDELFRGNLGECVRELLKEDECGNLQSE